jgi:FtsZ-interacting cell division protein ZipA
MTEMTWIWIAVAVVAVVVVAALVWWATRERRSRHLRHRFGPEYDHTVEERGSRTEAEAELAERERRVEEYELHDLSAPERDRFAQRWRAAQAEFVDNPEAAATQADALVKEVMKARGFPVADFDQRQADVSVEHPDVAHHYREAREIARLNRKGEATTEDLRQAMKHYRSLFDALLTGRQHQESEVA